MVEKLIRPLPPHVLAAKLAGDKTLLSELGRRGASVANKRRALRKIEAQRKVQSASQDLFAEEAMAEEHEAQIRADAQAHAEATRPGWED